MTRPPSPRPAEIRDARVAAGMTQTAAAAVIYCTLRAWQAWEAGTRRMHPAMWELWRMQVARPRSQLLWEDMRRVWGPTP